MVDGLQLDKTNRRGKIGVSTTGPVGGLAGATAGRDDRSVAGVCRQAQLVVKVVNTCWARVLRAGYTTRH